MPANFFVYSFAGTSFRRNLVRLFSRRPHNNMSLTTERRDELAMESSAKTLKPGTPK